MLEPQDDFRFDDALCRERGRLIHLCSRLSGGSDAAEDLAQEVLLEAWRHRQKLHDPAGYSQWLSAIARNVCLRWQRRRRRDGHGPGPATNDASAATDLADHLPDDFDLEVELERGELSDLLDRAMDLLPIETRNILVQRYICDTPYALLAVRLGVTEGAVAVRLHRGKAALRSVLATHLREDALSYGLVRAEAMWQETRIWCPLCGERRLLGRFAPERSELSLRCVACCPELETCLYRADLPAVFGKLTGYRSLLNRMQVFMDGHFAGAIPTGTLGCADCGQPIPLRMGLPEDAPPSHRAAAGVHVHCPRCDPGRARGWARLKMLSLARPEGRQFWREHPRLRALPDREATVAGYPSILTSFEPMGGGSRFEVVYAQSNYAVVDVRIMPQN